MLAWQRHKRSLCKGCGHPVDETMVPEAEGLYVSEPLTCHACAAREVAQSAAEGPEHAPTPGLVYTIERRDSEGENHQDGKDNQEHPGSQ